jgi:adenosylhomocysteine nucleosidase
MSNSTSILIHISARSEWRAMLAELPPGTHVTTLPVGEYFVTRLDSIAPGAELIVMRGGVGKVRAAASCQFALLTWRPRLYVLIGTAGAIAPDLQELDLILARRTVIYDLNPDLDPTSNALIADHTIEIDLAGSWDTSAMPFPTRVGTLVTGDRDITHANAHRLYEQYGADAGDWESGAVAYVCALNQTPCLIIRGVSDLPGGPVEEQLARYKLNTPEVMRRIWQTLPICLQQAGLAL